MSSQKLRTQFLDFFRQKKHKIIPSASIIPENDPTVLFTTAGMHPLVPFLSGEPHPQGKRLANFQKCIRTGDIERVGNQWHLTFFEMLGNWSLGDYFKKEAIEFSIEFLTNSNWLGLDKNRISISCFVGDKDAPKDTQSAQYWKRAGIPTERIYFFPKSDNWWGPAGKTGPCGPDTEMFFDSGKPYCKKGPGKKFGSQCNPSCDCGKFVEIWNDVFMEYNKKANGQYEKLRQKNVDTGMGLERTIAVLEKKDSVFETDLLKPIFDSVQQLSNKKEKSSLHSQRIVTDHIRSAVFILGDERGIIPNNTDQGYVLRRLIRRTIRHGKLLGIEKNFCAEIGKTVLKRFKDIYPELEKNRETVLQELEKEEKRFKQTLEKGTQLLQKQIQLAKKENQKKLDSKTVFDLYQSFGFPLEMTQEIARENGLKVDETAFQKQLKEHQVLSKKGAAQRFTGGLADHSTAVLRLHTATHLLNAALQQVLGKQVNQRGSNITSERLRFDFHHAEKVTPEQLKKVESLVNQKIKEGLAVKMEIMSFQKAQKLGAMAEFGGKYGAKVKVYSIWNPKTKEVFSRELCGGPHVTNTKELGHFKIKKEQSVAAGIRRIKAILE
ncbi:alanine--tRNA ligase [Candidatus Micrarchaeota archaeon]|nr:alanine--tRNA ligase [Candidatus Micrarchaeota archaeon]MBU1930340.1 alanine--tRNA ligase [Candidatus Micrarchaeota archaeon]